jgi:riboflavin biosynthesis pyrimidine reductase
VRQLAPFLIDPVDPLDVYGQLPDARERPSVRVNMIASADGATALSGVTRGLGGQADRDLFLLLRSFADVILVGAGTARSERYGPTRIAGDLQDRRRSRGQAPVPPIAVVTRTCRLDWDAPFFAAATARAIVVTVSDAPAADRSRAAAVADVVIAGDHDVDFGCALRSLGSRGARFVLAEGGPTLNGTLAAGGLIDELCLTVSPMLVSGGSHRVVAGPPLEVPQDLVLASVCEQDGFLFLRWRAAVPSAGPTRPTAAP